MSNFSVITVPADGLAPSAGTGMTKFRSSIYFQDLHLIHKQLEMHGCDLTTVAADALVLKHHAISIHNVELISMVLGQLRTKIFFCLQTTTLVNEITLWKKWSSYVRVKGLSSVMKETVDLFQHFTLLNTLRTRQNGRHFADDIFKCIFFNENVWIPIKTSLKFVPKGPINNIPALVQIMAWRLPGDKPLSEPMMVRLPTHICVTRPQWVNSLWNQSNVYLGWCLYSAICQGNGLAHTSGRFY